MRRVKTLAKWKIYELTGKEAEEMGGKFAAYLPESGPDTLDEPEWVADTLKEVTDFINSY